jgi:hypothetical protein
MVTRLEGRKRLRLRDRHAALMYDSGDGRDRVRRASGEEQGEGGWRLSEERGEEQGRMMREGRCDRGELVVLVRGC